jgi:excinuclease UvrABC nuclease subunit
MGSACSTDAVSPQTLQSLDDVVSSLTASCDLAMLCLQEQQVQLSNIVSSCALQRGNDESWQHYNSRSSTVALTGSHIAAMTQVLKDFAEHQEQCNDKLLADLRDRLAAIKSLNTKQYVWECKADSGWVPYSADISAVIESGYQVSCAANNSYNLLCVHCVYVRKRRF